MTKEECGGCRFFALRKDKAGAAGGGFCRRFPPAFSTGWQDESYNIVRWPIVITGSWCGEFSASKSQEGSQ